MATNSVTTWIRPSAKAKRKAKFTEAAKLVLLDFGTENSARIPPGFKWVLGAVEEMERMADNSVDEAQSIGYIQRLVMAERVAFFNALHRILKPGAKCLIAVPYWASGAAYGDPRAQWPPVSEHFFAYLSREWRAVNVPGIDWITCDFDHTLGYNLHPAVAIRAQDYQQHAVTFFKEAAQDLFVTLVKR
jgi:hypothetical protein